MVLSRRPVAALLGAGALLLSPLAAAPAAAQAPQARDIDASCPQGTRDHPFTDVAPTDPFSAAVGCLLHWEVTRGTSETTYSPRAEVTREQMAGFIARTIEAAGGSLPAGQDAFQDDDQSGFEDDINRLAAAGVVNGTGPGTYAPQDPVTRAQMAAFLVRAHDYRAGQDGMAPLSADGDYFPDDEWSSLEDDINAAASAGIAGGHVDGTYRPADGVRRDHMAAFITRTLDLLVEEDLAEVPAGPDPLPGGALVPCANPQGFTIGRPEAWSTNSGDVVPECSQFHPEPFEVPAGTDERVAAITTYIDPVPFTEAATPSAAVNLDRADTVLDGRQAVRLQYEAAEGGFWPAGTPVTAYVVELPEQDGPRTLFLDTVGVGDLDYATNRVVLDRMARSLDLGAQGREDVIAFYGGVADLAVTAETVGSEICLSIVGDADSICVSQPVPGTLQTAMLGDVGPVLAGVATADVFRVTMDLRTGGTSSVLPAPVTGSDTVAFAVPINLDAVERFHLLDLTGATIAVVEIGG